MSNKLVKRGNSGNAGVTKRQRRGNMINQMLKKMGYGDNAHVSVDKDGHINITAKMADGTTKVIGGENPNDLVKAAYKEADADPAAKKALDNYVEHSRVAKTLVKGMK